MKKLCFLSVVAVFILLFISSNLYAYYKWYDTNGAAHFTQSPPPENDRTKDGSPYYIDEEQNKIETSAKEEKASQIDKIAVELTDDEIESKSATDIQTDADGTDEKGLIDKLMSFFKGNQGAPKSHKEEPVSEPTAFEKAAGEWMEIKPHKLFIKVDDVFEDEVNGGMRIRTLIRNDNATTAEKFNITVTFFSGKEVIGKSLGVIADVTPDEEQFQDFLFRSDQPLDGWEVDIEDIVFEKL